MVPRSPRRSIVAIGAGGLALSLALAGCSPLMKLIPTSKFFGRAHLPRRQRRGDLETAEALADAFEAANPNIKITSTLRPSGSEGDNLIKTRLATGDMTDMFWYNSGSLLQALNPDKTCSMSTDEPWVDRRSTRRS